LKNAAVDKVDMLFDLAVIGNDRAFGYASLRTAKGQLVFAGKSGVELVVQKI
jgi:hypothetical protein